MRTQLHEMLLLQIRDNFELGLPADAAETTELDHWVGCVAYPSNGVTRATGAPMASLSFKPQQKMSWGNVKCAELLRLLCSLANLGQHTNGQQNTSSGPVPFVPCLLLEELLQLPLRQVIAQTTA